MYIKYTTETVIFVTGWLYHLSSSRPILEQVLTNLITRELRSKLGTNHLTVLKIYVVYKSDVHLNRLDH